MKGFNPKWKDLPDYILGITKEIWEDRNVHTLHHYYTKDMAKRSPHGVVIGNIAVINETLQSLALYRTPMPTARTSSGPAMRPMVFCRRIA